MDRQNIQYAVIIIDYMSRLTDMSVRHIVRLMGIQGLSELLRMKPIFINMNIDRVAKELLLRFEISYKLYFHMIEPNLDLGTSVAGRIKLSNAKQQNCEELLYHLLVEADEVVS